MKEYDDNNTPPKRKLGCVGKSLIVLAILVLGNYFIFHWIGKAFSGFQTKIVTIDDNSIYRIDMKGDLIEQGQENNSFLTAFNQMYNMNRRESVGLDDLLSNIKYAKEDPKISGILLLGGELSMGPAKAKELRDALLDFKSSGKWIYAYSEYYGLLNYYVASVADSVFINPIGTIHWDGLHGNKLYYTRLLKKLGIDIQIFKVGSFKAAVEPFSRTSMSEEDKKQTKRYLNGVWSLIKNEVARSRHLTTTKLDEYANQVFSAQAPATYLQSQMVDAIMYKDELDTLLYRKFSNSKPNYVSTSDLNQVEIHPSADSNKIAFIYAEGTIVDYPTQRPVIDKKNMLREIRKVLRNKDIKAVVFRINSPGGSADVSEQIWHVMSLFKDKNIPVVVSMSDYAASGGYYIAACADYIIAQPTTITGSIGIFGIVPNYYNTMNKIGVDIDSVNTNVHAGIYSNMVMGKTNNAENNIMQKQIERGYELFLNRCASGRNKTTAQINNIAQGRIWLGQDALSIGLVDQLGGIDDAITKAAQLAQLEHYKISYYPKKTNQFDEIMKLLDAFYSDEEKLIMQLKEFLSKPRIMCLAPQIEINKN